LKARLQICHALFGLILALPGTLLLAQEEPSFASNDTGEFNLKQFGLLAIQDDGRRKPIDTFASETLTTLSGRSLYRDKAGRTWRAKDFVLSALLETHDWRSEPMVLVSLGKLKEVLGLDRMQKRFSFAQLTALPELNRLAGEVHTLLRAEMPLDRLQQEVRSVSERLTLFARIMDGSAFLIVPADRKATDPWVVPPEFGKYYQEAQFAPVQKELQALATAYTQGDAFQFSRSSKRLRDGLSALSPAVYPTDNELQLEYRYNHFQGFYRAIFFYGAGFVLLLAAYLRNHGRILRNIGVSIALIGLLLQATAITLRCLIAGRPPVTNMYESIIWVSFAVSVFGMIFFVRYRTTLYLLASLPASFLALLLVHQMPIAMSASIDPLVPVLRDNFWLTIHVLTITLSYAAFLLAWALGHILLFLYAWRPVVTRADGTIHFWLYRVIQLGVLLLAAGTILGGVWANYSWGRFWGWDPKETWALIALLCYIVMLHGRLAGWWTQFGLAVGSVVCFLAIVMAWYGVNFVLGKGLHSYGFGIGGETYVAILVLADLAFVGLAIARYRLSRRVVATKPREVEGETVAV
jgi:cytochrome c-type biogenesis protein CcsB